MNSSEIAAFLAKTKAMQIVLVGYMGSGKSTIGKILSNQMGIKYMDLDAYIEEQHGTTIPELFKAKGELFFRKLEHQSLLQVLEENANMILSTGGGTPCYSGNMDLLVAHTPHVVYLQMTVGALAKRLESEMAHRPVISHLAVEELPEFIGKHLFERAPFYEQAQHKILCDEKSPDQIVAEINNKLV